MRLLVLAAAVVGLVACSQPTDYLGTDLDRSPVARNTGATTTDSAATDPGGTNGTTGAAGAKIQAIAPSCATQHGGQTCGPNGDQDCCQLAPAGPGADDTKLNKYMITAGRMRTFIDSVHGDVASFVKTLPADKWKDEWNVADAIPTDADSANVALGPSGKKSCEQGGFTGHTYWTPKTDDDFSDFSQDVLDEKALNCVPWELLQAMCAFDGGHLATKADLKAAFTNGGTTKFPWGNDALASNSAPDDKDRLNIEGAFATDPLPATFRKRDDGLPAEVSFMIAPPGRFPNGNNQVGIADSAGNLLEWVGDSTRQFIWKADFEHHGSDAANVTGSIWMDARNGLPLGVGFGAWVWGDGQLYGQAGTSDEKGGYYSIGGRCAF